jgi:hypothetical protein
MSVRRVLALSTVLWISATVAAFVASPHGGDTGRSEATLTSSVPAAGLDGITLVVPGGRHSMEIQASEPGSPDVVNILVFVHGGTGLGILSKPAPPVEGVALNPQTSGRHLALGLDHADTDVLRTEWTITVPARFSAHVSTDAGRVVFSRLEGALSANVGAGSIRADVSASQHGPADLESVVGGVSVRLSDRDIHPSSGPGPGAHWAFPAAGQGGPPISLHVTVGTASLWVR